MLPEGWSNDRIGDWLKERKEKSIHQDQYRVLTSSRRGLVSQTDYYSGRIVGRSNVGFNVVPPGHITYRSRSDDGKFFFNMNQTDQTGIVSHFYPVVHFPKGSNKFFLEFLNNKRHALSAHSVGTSQKVLSLTALRSIRFPIPPLPEQQKIAEILSTWDQAIEATQALLDNAKRQKRALMQQLLSGKRRFPEFQGQEWEDVRLGDLLNGKKRKGKIVQTNEDGEGVPYIGASSFDGVFDIYTIDNNLVQCNKDDLLVLWDGENAGMATVGLKGAVSSTVVRYRLDLAQVNPTFICELMALRNSQIRSVREGSGIPHMPKDFDTWFRFSLPSKAEQDAIAEMLQQASENVKAQAMLIKQLTDEKRALMQQLLTGKRRVMVDA